MLRMAVFAFGVIDQIPKRIVVEIERVLIWSSGEHDTNIAAAGNNVIWSISMYSFQWSLIGGQDGAYRGLSMNTPTPAIDAT